MALQRSLFNAAFQHDKSIAEYLIRLQDLRAQIAMGGVKISDAWLTMHLAKDPLPDPLMRASDRISVRETTFKQAVAILTRADLRSNSSTSRPMHNAFLTERINKVTFTERADLYRQRCKTNRHPAIVCRAPEPGPAAYAAYEKHIIHYKPRPYGPRPEKRDKRRPCIG